MKLMKVSNIITQQDAKDGKLFCFQPK